VVSVLAPVSLRYLFSNLAADPTNSMQPLRGRRAGRLVALLLGAGLAAGVLELTLRACAPQPKSWLEIYRRLPDPLNYGFEPGASCIADTGDARWRVQIDAAGRRVAIAPEPARGSAEAPAELAVIGDSFVFGYGVEFEDSLVGLLNGVWPGRRSFRSEGVPGYGPVQYLSLLERDLAEAPPPCGVVVVSYLGNDFFDCVWEKHPDLNHGTLGDTGGVRGMLKRHSHVYRLFSRLWHSLGLNAIEAAELEMFSNADWSGELLVQATTTFESTFRAMKTDCEQHKVPLLVVLIPPIEEIRFSSAPTPGREYGLPGARARELLTRIGVEYLDCTPMLAQAGYATCFLKFDGHLSRRGNEIARDCIIRAMNQSSNWR